MGKFRTEWLYLTSYNFWSFVTILRPPPKDGIEQEPCLVFSPITKVGGEHSDMDVFQAFLALIVCDNDELEGVVDPSLAEAARSPPLGFFDGSTSGDGSSPNGPGQRCSAADLQLRNESKTSNMHIPVATRSLAKSIGLSDSWNVVLKVRWRCCIFFFTCWLSWSYI